MRILFLVVVWLFAAGCSSQSGKVRDVLPPPSGAPAAAATQIEKGNALFTSKNFSGAEGAYREALAADSMSAEAHYNLALTLERAGRQAEAKKHYMEAANLAPGNKVIWDSPPLRERTSGLNYNVDKKSFLDPSGKGY
jgi:Tfp pilus assembly protein PilF